VSIKPSSQLYCDATSQVLVIDGTGFHSRQIFDYTLTLTGEGCSALHATTLVTRVSETRLALYDDLTGCTGDIFAQLTYKRHVKLDKVKIASLNEECVDQNVTAVYCPVEAQTLYIHGSGFDSLEVFDYTVTIQGAACGAVHATALVTRVSDTLLTVEEDLTGCNADLFAILRYKNNVPGVTKVASLSEDCGDILVEHNKYNSDINGATAATAFGVISLITMLLTVLFA
jgi:hypothetical protein